MLVQHFLPSPTTTSITDSSFSPSSSSTKTQKTNILSPFFNSESTGFQPTSDENHSLGYTGKIKTHLSTWPKKLTSVMEIHRQRFSQLNPRFRQQTQQTQYRATANNQSKPSFQQSVICPVILPTTSRSQPRQQARSKQNQDTHLPPAQPNRRSNTAHIKQQTPINESNNEYITLANLTKLIHVLQTQETLNDHESSTDTSTSTTNSARQRVQQHLQATATRWWKPTRSSDGHLSVPAPSSINSNNRSSTPTQLLTSDILQQKQRQDFDNLPLLTVVSNSTRHLNIPTSNGNTTSKYDESESSTEIQTTIISSIVQLPKSANIKLTRQEPLIMQAHGMRLRSHDPYQFYNQHNNMNFLQQQRLIRQT